MMNIYTPRRKMLTGVFTLLFTIQLVSCGTLLYPERRGRVGGQIDPAVAVLDGVGLLVFFVPGVIAFAVDFVTGAIYLSGGKHSSLDTQGIDNIVRLKMDDKPLSMTRLQAIIKEQKGIDIDMIQNPVSVMRVEDSASAKLWLMAMNPAGNDKTDTLAIVR